MDGLLQHLGKGARLNHVLPPARAEFAFEELLQQFHSKIALGHPAHLGKKLIGKDRNIRLCKSCGSEDVHHTFGRHRARDDLAHRVIRSGMKVAAADAEVVKRPDAVANRVCDPARRREGGEK